MNKKKFKPKQKTKSKYAYITEKDKAELRKLQIKYKVSLSNITEKASLEIIKTKHWENHQEELKKFITEYYSNEKGIINHIKPKWELTEINQIVVFTNSLHELATNFKNLTEVLGKEEVNKIKVSIMNELQKSKEAYWDLNNIIRTNARAIKMLGNAERHKNEIK